MMKCGKASKYTINKYKVFAEKLLKKRAKPLWDSSKSYTKEERDAALDWLAKALKVKISTRSMLQFVMRFKRMQEKKIRSYLMQCLEKNAAPELTMCTNKIPHWVKDVEAKMKMLPKLIEECQIAGVLPDTRTQTMWAHVTQLLLMESYEHHRLPTIVDAQTVAKRVGVDNYQLIYRLWLRQNDFALRKFRTVHEAGDVVRDPSMGLTVLEWRVIDAVLLYTKDFPLICLRNKVQQLAALFLLVVQHKIDQEDGVDPKKKWAIVVHEYSKKYVTSPSGIVLQRRWWELKREVYENIRERLRTVGYKVYPLLVEIAVKYPHSVRESPGDWHDIVNSGKVYDVSNIDLSSDSSDDESSNDVEVVDDDTCNSSCIIDLDSDFDSEEERPLIIDEEKSERGPPKSDYSNKKIKDTQTVENIPTIDLDKDQADDVGLTITIISMSDEDKIKSKNNTLNNDMNSQSTITVNDDDCPKDNSIVDKNIKTVDDTTECAKSDLTYSENKSDDTIPTNNNVAGNSKDSLSENIYSDLKDNFTESNDNNPTDVITVTDDSIPNPDITTNIDPIKNNNEATNDNIITDVSNPADSTIKPNYKAMPLIDLSADSVTVIESELQKLELEFQIQMRCMMNAVLAEANAEQKKQVSKKDGDKNIHDLHPIDAGTVKVDKISSSKKVNKSKSTKKKNVKPRVNKKTKVYSASTKKKKTNLTNLDVNEDKINKKNASNIDIDEGNVAAKSLINTMHDNAEAIAETLNEQAKSILATVYTCKGPDGRDLGHVILPAPITKDAVTVSLKTDNGTLSINSAVVGETIQHLKETIPLNESAYKIKQLSSESFNVEPSNASNETDLDLLQKIDPAQAQSVIIFSDSEDENENMTINDTNQENVSIVRDASQANTSKISDTDGENVQNVAGQKDDYINLNDVKKFLNNHSLDDILTKMGDMVVKKEVNKTEKEAANRICESFIYISDSDDDTTRSNEELANNNDVSQNEFTMTDNATVNVNNSISTEETKESIIETHDLLNTPNASVLIIPPNFFDASKLAPKVNASKVWIPPVVQGPSAINQITSEVENSPPNVQTLDVQSSTSNALMQSSCSKQPSKDLLSTSSSSLSNPIETSPVAPPLVLSRAPNFTRATSPSAESSISDAKIQTPNSNVVTMIINDKIKELFDQKHDVSRFKNICDDNISIDGDLPITENPNSKTCKNKTSDKKPRRTKIYSETAGYSGLFKLKDRSTKETVGMLCRIKEEKKLVSEVTEKIDNYLEKFKDEEDKNKGKDDNSKEKKDEEVNIEEKQDNSQVKEDNINTRSEFFNIINKKLEIERKRITSDGFLKMMLENCQAKTLWTSGDKEISDEGNTDEGCSADNIDPKLIMDARVYLPKLDEIETYNKNRRVDFSINTRRISKFAYKILNYRMKSDDPALITENSQPKSTVPISEHIETEIAVALKNKGGMEQEVFDKNVSKAITNRKNPRSRTKDGSFLKLVNLRTELNNLTKQIKREREMQQSLNGDGTNVEREARNAEKLTRLTEKIRIERQKQQLLDKTTNIVQRIKFEIEDDFNSNDNTSIGTNDFENNDMNNINEQETRTTMNESNNDFSNGDIYDNEDMELDTVANDTLILDSSNTLTNNVTNIVGTDKPSAVIEKDIKGDDNTKTIDSENTSHFKDTNERISVSVKVEPMENHNDLSDDEGIPIKRLRKPQYKRNYFISSDEEDLPKSKRDRRSNKNRKSRISNDDEDWSKSDEELGMRIENELLKEDFSNEPIQSHDGLLKEIRRSDDVPMGKSNIEEMLKLCKPVRLCLERVQVPKDTDSQVRRVELPDRTSLKRHHAPTAHVAPIRALQAGSHSEGLPDLTLDEYATEADIENLLEQLTKETYESHRLEESGKAKRRRVSESAERPCSSKEKKNEGEQRNDKKSDRSRKKKDTKQSDSDDEIDAVVEWQRQKNINYKFFNFNPINAKMEPDPKNTRRNNRNPKTNKKLGHLIKRVVIDDMIEKEISNLGNKNNDKTTENETQTAVESIINNVSPNVELKKSTKDDDIIEVTPKHVKLIKALPPEEMKLTPLFTKIQSKSGQTEASGIFSQLVPIATKIAPPRKNTEKEKTPKPAVMKKYHYTKFKNLVQYSKKGPSTTDNQPSTSKDSHVSRDPAPSTSKESTDFICISDNSNDVFELTHTISVKNNDNNVTSKEKSTKSVCLPDLMREHNIKKQNVPQTSSAPKPFITLLPGKKAFLNNDSYNSEKHPTVSNASIYTPYSYKVYDSPNLRNTHANSPVKIMEIGPIGPDAEDMKFVLNEYTLNEHNNNNENCPQITNVTSIPSSIDLDGNNSNDELVIDENALGNNSNDELVTDGNALIHPNNKEQIDTEQLIPRIENVMSVQSIGSNDNNIHKDNNVEKRVRGLSLLIENVRSIPAGKGDDNTVDIFDPANSNDCYDEHYDSDLDTLQINESCNSNCDEGNIAQPLPYYLSNPEAKNNVIPVKFEYGKAKISDISKNSQKIRQYDGAKKKMDNITDPKITESDSSNEKIGEISNISSGIIEPALFEDIAEPSNCIDIYSKLDEDLGKKSNYDVKPAITDSKEISETNNKEDSHKICESTEVSDTALCTNDSKIQSFEDTNVKNYHSLANNDKLDIDGIETTKMDKEACNRLYSEEGISGSQISNDQDNPTNNEIKNTKENSDQENSETKENIDQVNSKTTENLTGGDSKSGENLPLTSKANDTDNKETIVERPKTFLKVVPIQILRGEPLVASDKMNTETVIKKDTSDKGQAMPFSFSDDEATQSAHSDEEEVCSMPVISNVMSLSANQNALTNRPSGSQHFPLAAKLIKGNKPGTIGQSNVWNSNRQEPSTSAYRRLNHDIVSSNPSMTVAEFIKDRDCTKISLLCFDDWRPLWAIGEYYILTNLKLPVSSPTYWTVGPRSQCTRLVMDDNALGSTVVGALSVPDEVFLENNWYKKLSTDPMIYAKIWFVVPDIATCKEMLSCNVQMQLFSSTTGAIMPLTVLSHNAPPSAQHRGTSGNVDVPVLELGTMINTTLQRSMQQQEPVVIGDVITLDSDEE